MPTYEYACNACHSEFETQQRISEPPHAVCPSCGSADTKRLISHSSFVLKGSGWYVTDYARKSGSAGSSPGSHAKNGNGDGAKPAESPKPSEKPAEQASATASQPSSDKAPESGPAAPGTPS
jgi:putative FmdB family regulatory protein